MDTACCIIRMSDVCTFETKLGLDGKGSKGSNLVTRPGHQGGARRALCSQPLLGSLDPGRKSSSLRPIYPLLLDPICIYIYIIIINNNNSNNNHHNNNNNNNNNRRKFRSQTSDNMDR